MVNNSEIQLQEGLELGDLRRVVDPLMSIDKFRSKMGDDKDIIVVGLTILSKNPALDLVNFLEKSYDWVLDADISPGETADGNYYVFVELQRSKGAVVHIMSMMEGLLRLTEQSLADWAFTYLDSAKKISVSKENLEKLMILDPHDYVVKMHDTVAESINLNKLRAAAGITVLPTNIINQQLVGIQHLAGVK